MEGELGPSSEAAPGLNSGQSLAVFTEFNYVRPKMTLGSVAATGNLYQAGAGARIYLPLKHKRLRTCVPAFGGFLRSNGTATLDGNPYYRSLTSGAYVGAGFGAEFGITERFGLRPEFRYFREFWYPQYGPANQNNGVRATVGLYYRFGVR